MIILIRLSNQVIFYGIVINYVHVDAFHSHAIKKFKIFPMNEDKKLQCCRRLINKQHPQVSGLFSIPNFIYSSKCSAQSYGAAILV